MKASEIKELSPEEMNKKVKTLKETYFNLRFQHETGQLENSSKLKETKKDIARVKTVIRQVQTK
ncbi:MAG: 50S ribosomal protein L29 [Desulfobacteraceae bacterium]|nr:MAG: 50S ribosomal protein L29 [Desulfobacteraceae bacterium]